MCSLLTFHLRNRNLSPYFVGAFGLAALGCGSLLIAMFSPYWLVSKPISDTNFVKLGLWNVCFRHYQHPSMQFDSVFDGCYSLHGHKSQSIRSWLQPGWFIFVQCLMTCSVLLSLLSICLFIYLTWPLAAAIKIFVSVFTFVLQALSALMIFLGTCIFGAMCFERSWIQHPKSNHLSWGYYFAILASLLQSCAAVCILIYTFQMRKYIYRNNIVYHIPI